MTLLLLETYQRRSYLCSGHVLNAFRIFGSTIFYTHFNEELKPWTINSKTYAPTYTIEHVLAWLLMGGLYVGMDALLACRRRSICLFIGISTLLGALFLSMFGYTGMSLRSHLRHIPFHWIKMALLIVCFNAFILILFVFWFFFVQVTKTWKSRYVSRLLLSLWPVAFLPPTPTQLICWQGEYVK